VLLQHLAGTQNTGPGPSCCHHHNERPASTSRSRTRTRSSDNVAIFVHHKWNVNSLRRPTSVRIDSSKPRTDTGKPVDTPALPTLPAPSSPRCRPVALSPHVPPPLTHEIRPQRYQKKARGRPAAPPFTPVFFYLPPTHLIINTTLAGVAQSVERVALITAKRSTSRSWVRAPPSAIPISKLIRAAVLLPFVRLIVSASSSILHWHARNCGIPQTQPSGACQLLALFA
jgi:hypothetical protein